jgi:hypothetical protein
MPFCGQVVLHRRGGQQGGGAQQVMAAAMAVAAGFDRAVLGHAGFLAQAGQGVILAEDGDDRAFLARLAHDGGGDAGQLARDAEALPLQHLGTCSAQERCSGTAVPACPRRGRSAR